MAKQKVEVKAKYPSGKKTRAERRRARDAMIQEMMKNKHFETYDDMVDAMDDLYSKVPEEHVK